MADLIAYADNQPPNQPITALPVIDAGKMTLHYADGTYTFPYVGPAAPDISSVNNKLDSVITLLSKPASVAPFLYSPTFTDDFATDDPSRWIAESDGNFPPKPGTPGKWLRIYFFGWPSNKPGQDPSARFFPNNKEAQCYEDKGVVVAHDGSGLQITATRDTANTFAQPWTSGVISQNRDLAICYGYFELVAKLPLGKGLWPAFWLMASNIGSGGEIDVMEQLGNDPRTIYCTPHNAPPFDGICQPCSVDDVTDGYHKYGLLWTATTCRWFYDGRLICEQPTPPEAVNQPHYMIVNLAVGGEGSWPGTYDDSTPSPSIMAVRRVSSYALGSWGDSLIPATPV